MRDSTPTGPQAQEAGEFVRVPRDLMQQCIGWTGIASRWNLTEDTLAKLEILHHDLNRVSTFEQPSPPTNWQERCLELGFVYGRAPDDHWVECTQNQAVELLREVLGVDAIVTPPVAPSNYHDAYRSAYDDMCDWKRRCLIAEADLKRMCDAHNAENGPTFMGEPVLTTPARVVSDAEVCAMTKVLQDAWAKAEPNHGVTLYPDSYIASFVDMARAALSTLQSGAEGKDGEIAAIRTAVADYMYSEGCSCCRGFDHIAHEEVLANLLGVKPYDDLSGYDFTPYRTTALQPGQGERL